MSALIVLENPKDWPLHLPGAEVVSAKKYLLDPRYSDLRAAKVFNLCKSYRYQRMGYYVSLLAAARGHKPLPGISTIQDLKLSPLVGIVSRDLDDLIQWSLTPLKTKHFVLSVYFGSNMARRHARLSQALFNQYPAPFLRAEFKLDGKWTLEDVEPIAASEIPEVHRAFVLARAQEYFSRPQRRARPRAAYKYDLAILNNPEAAEKPSNNGAIRRFTRAAKAVGLDPEIISRDDAGRLAEFDALFIRETTYVNHHTFRFARRASAEGLVVIDDPQSILKCTNKVYLAELFDHHEVPSPRTLVVHRDNIGEVEARIGLPCVIKRPDSSFSQGVIKVHTHDDLDRELRDFLERSELAIAQEFTPSEYDWRVGVLDRRPLYCCKYHMARGHWQIVGQDRRGERSFGDVESIPLEKAPVEVLALGLRVANLIGDGLYGVDIKEINGRLMVMEINDNPSIDAGYEDLELKDELYLRIMRVFLERIEARGRRGRASA